MQLSRRAFMATSAGIVAAAAAGADDPNRSKLRVCIIGDTRDGGYGHNLHLAWAGNENVDIVALADPDEAGRKSHADAAGAPRVYADYAEMLQKERPDLVTIGPRCTRRHREYLEAAAAAGAHGFMEKPVADNLVDADAMVSAIEAKKLRWAIAFNFRVHPVMEHARKLVMEEGLVGELLEVRGHGKEDHRAGGEDLLVLGVHSFDMMRAWLGAPLSCSAEVTVNGRRATAADAHPATEPLGAIAGDRIWATFMFANGVTGHFASTRNADGNGGRWGLDFCGSKGVVSVRFDALPQAWWLPEPSWTGSVKTAAWQPLPGAPEVPAMNEARRYGPITGDLITAIREDRTPRVSLQDGRDALEMVQAVYAAHWAGGRVELPLKERRHPLQAQA